MYASPYIQVNTYLYTDLQSCSKTFQLLLSPYRMWILIYNQPQTSLPKMDIQRICGMPPSKFLDNIVSVAFPETSSKRIRDENGCRVYPFQKIIITYNSRTFPDRLSQFFNLGPFNKYVMVEGVDEIRDKPIRKFRGKRGQDFFPYVTEEYKISNRSFTIFSENSKTF